MPTPKQTTWQKIMNSRSATEIGWNCDVTELRRD